MTTTNEPESAREIIQMRAISAPRALVWKALTDPQHADAWWGPSGFITMTKSMDVRAGGEWLFEMKHPEYGAFDERIVYLEVKAPERLVMDHTAADGSGGFLSTITLEDLGKKTLVTMRALLPSVAVRNQLITDVNAVEGGHETLARLADWCVKNA
jgi:uncharacterized protein YndB with AHSA1/START domain